MRIPIIIIALSLLVSTGCNRREDSGPTTNAAGGAGKNPAQPSVPSKKSPAEQEPEASPTSPLGKDADPKQTATPDDLRSITLESNDQKARVSFRLPSGWKVAQSLPKEAQLIPPASTHQDYVRTACRLTFGLRQCVDLCTTEHTLAGLDGSWENWSKQWVQPATRTGKPAKDAVKTTWKSITDEKKDGFRILSGHLLYPEDAKKTALVRDRIVTRCTQMNLGDTLSLDTECRGALAHEKALREGFESVCRSIAIKQLPVPENDPKPDDEPKPAAPGAEIPSESENTAVQK